jgi:hypothetical protein
VDPASLHHKKVKTKRKKDDIVVSGYRSGLAEVF